MWYPSKFASFRKGWGESESRWIDLVETLLFFSETPPPPPSPPDFFCGLSSGSVDPRPLRAWWSCTPQAAPPWARPTLPALPTRTWAPNRNRRYPWGFSKPELTPIRPCTRIMGMCTNLGASEIYSVLADEMTSTALKAEVGDLAEKAKAVPGSGGRALQDLLPKRRSFLSLAWAEKVIGPSGQSFASSTCRMAIVVDPDGGNSIRGLEHAMRIPLSCRSGCSPGGPVWSSTPTVRYDCVGKGLLALSRRPALVRRELSGMGKPGFMSRRLRFLLGQRVESVKDSQP